MTFFVKMHCRLLSAEWLMQFADEAEKEALKVETKRTGATRSRKNVKKNRRKAQS